MWMRRCSDFSCAMLLMSLWSRGCPPSGRGLSQSPTPLRTRESKIHLYVRRAVPGTAWIEQGWGGGEDPSRGRPAYSRGGREVKKATKELSNLEPKRPWIQHPPAIFHAMANITLTGATTLAQARTHRKSSSCFRSWMLYPTLWDNSLCYDRLPF